MKYISVLQVTMGPKRPVPCKASASNPKRQRKMLTIPQKVQVLDMLKEGKSLAEVGRHYEINESSVRTIKKQERAIRSTAALSFSKTQKRVVTQTNKAVVKMETQLAMWIADLRKRNVGLDTNTIRTKAKNLYDNIAAELGVTEDAGQDEGGDDDDDGEASSSSGPSTSSSSQQKKGFVASKGWFEKFQKRHGIRSVNIYGESASADNAAADKYVRETFQNIIEEGRYKPEQVFNMDETGLFWKRMPSRTFIMKDEARAPGFKAQKDRITLIMCGNAAGHLIKPGLIYKAKNPRALKNKNKNVLPVYWMHNKKAWITKVLTLDWFTLCFIPQVKIYLAEKGLPFKVLLLMDNAGGHATDLTYDGVQIEFLPANTTSLIQPMDQGVIRAFKALYTRNALQHLVEAMDTDPLFSLKSYWRQYTIASCLTTIQRALEEMKSQTVQASWKKLWPGIVHDYEGFSLEEVQHSAVDKAVRLAQMLEGEGFTDMTRDEVNELIDEHSGELTDEDLMELTKSGSEEEEEEAQDDDDEEEQPEEETGLTLENLAKLVRIIREGQSWAEEIDPDMTRSITFKNMLESSLVPYKNELAQKKKQRAQLPITMFFTRVKKPKPTPVDPEEPSTSRVPQPTMSPVEVILTEEVPPSREVTPTEEVTVVPQADRPYRSDDEDPDDVDPLEEL